MNFSTASAIQHNRHTYYTVHLVDPQGNRQRVGRSQRKSGTGLMTILRGVTVQDIVDKWPGAATMTFKKHKDRLEFSNGWNLVFGDTIRQEASS